MLMLIVLVYNGLVWRKNRVENAFATTDVLLKKRYDLIPNLVETVKGYARHERSLLDEVTQLRAKAMSGRLSSDETVAVNNLIGRALLGITAVVEDYPDLKANENFMQLQRALNEVEEQISAGRRAYNAAVTDLNNAIEMFPSNVIAGMAGYCRRQLLEVPALERRTPSAGELLRNPEREGKGRP